MSVTHDEIRYRATYAIECMPSRWNPFSALRADAIGFIRACIWIVTGTEPPIASGTIHVNVWLDQLGIQYKMTENTLTIQDAGYWAWLRANEGRLPLMEPAPSATTPPKTAQNDPDPSKTGRASEASKAVSS
jgi:hypothetical protein